MCKHILLVAMTFKIVKMPNSYKDQQLGTKPKRGRPAKATKALQKDK